MYVISYISTPCTGICNVLRIRNTYLLYKSKSTLVKWHTNISADWYFGKITHHHYYL